MSGIAGIVYNNTLEDTHDIQQMTDAITHRGPDGEGFIAISTITGKKTELGGKKTSVQLPLLSNFNEKANIYLAHKKLSLSSFSKIEHQPMTNKERNIWITYDGEIYNYKSLKNELAEFNFNTNTDTEVLLCAYEKWGINCLHHFNGIWSFVIYDEKKNILFGARDRFGSKPLYYTLTSDFFVFNSEIKGLLAKPEVSRKINKDVSISYLRTGLEYFNGETFFRDIFELDFANYFIFDLDKKRLTMEQYYQIPFCDRWESFNEKKCADYIEGVRNKVLNAVDLRLEGNLAAGSCLSGGMDSSAIVCSINELLKEKSYKSIGSKQKVITACYEDFRIDESTWAQCVVDYVSADWFKIFPKREELMNDLSDLIYSQDIPFGSTSIYAQYRVMKAAKEMGLKIVLDGQGGDEVFTGYVPYYKMFYSELSKNNERALLTAEQDHVMNTPFGDIDIENLIQNENIKAVFKKYIPKRIKDVLRTFSGQPESKYIRSTGKTFKPYPYNTLNQMLQIYLSHISLPQNLRWADRCSMWFSIGYRAPLADDIDLIEYVFQIPGVYKIHNGWSKYLLREAMGSLIPKKIKERTDKIGFATPEYKWLQLIKPFIFDGVNSDINDILKISQMEKNWEKIFAKQNKSGITDIWKYINFILWFKTFKVTL